MGTDRRKQAEEIFQLAVDLPPDDRTVLLQQRCGPDQALLLEVQELLRTHDVETGGFLKNPLVTRLTEPGEKPGDHIGSYKLLSLLGEGGMGVVYLAEQTQPIHRQVAIKLIKLGMDTKEIIARFDSERQALAMLSHPNVATVLDVGATAEGRPYFVMEYVAGVPITDYCDTNRLTLCERLRLFIKVCLAVQHAHQKGIIHRDLKPSNVLVTIDDAEAVPKVIDFGVAKATNRALTERTLFTEFGATIGTPEYMSPEQAVKGGLDIDTRADVYSLGVLLYELMTGSLPFEPSTLRGVALDEIHRIIREEEPPKPSTRLESRSQAPPGSVQQQSPTPATLARDLRGDIDWITMKALEKDRTRRYASASEFAEDVRRHLANEPTLAGPPSMQYRLAKFVRRHRTAVSAAAAMLAVLIVATCVSILMAVHANRARHQAQHESSLRAIAESAAREAADAALVDRNRARSEAYVAGILGAASALQQSDASLARHLLEQCPLEFRHWEWHYLTDRLDQSVRTLDPKIGMLMSIAVDRRGASVAVRSSTGHLLVIDATTGREVFRTLDDQYEEGDLGRLAFDASGSRLASLDISGRAVRVWDVRGDGRDDEQRGVFGDGAVVWMAEDEEPALLTAAQRGFFVHFAFSPDGRWVATGNNAGTIRIWERASGQLVAEQDDHGADVWALVFRGDGERLATGSADQTIKIREAATGEVIQTLSGHTSAVTSLQYDTSGRRIASASLDRTIRVWNADTGDALFAFTGHEGPVTSVAFMGGKLVSASTDGTIRIWELPDHADVHEVRLQDGFSLWDSDSAIFSSDGRWLAGTVDRNKLLIWDTADGAIAHSIDATDMSPQWPLVAAWHPNGEEIAIASTNNDIVLIDVKRQVVLASLDGHESPIRAIAFTADGSRLASASDDGAILIWHRSSANAPRVLHASEAQITGVAFSRDGTRLVSVDAAGAIRVWDANSGGLQLSPPSMRDASVSCVSFTADDSRIVVAGGGQFQPVRIAIYDAGDGRLVRDVPGFHFAGHSGPRVAISPDSQRLVVSGLVSSGVAIYDASTAKALLSLTGSWSLAACNAAFVGPEGRKLIACDSYGRLQAWEASGFLEGASPLITAPERRDDEGGGR